MTKSGWFDWYRLEGKQQAPGCGWLLAQLFSADSLEQLM